MNRTFGIIVFTLLLVLGSACNSGKKEALNVIPTPKSVEHSSGSFFANAETKIIVSNEDLVPIAQFFSEQVNMLADFEMEVSLGDVQPGQIVFMLDNNLSEEEFQIHISDAILLSAANYEGIAKGTASLIQMLSLKKDAIAFPKVVISDSPDFDYRSVMLDLARYFHPVETIEETIDMLWYYKIKYLQLHLSDDERFTFPLDEFPKLQSVNEQGEREYYTTQELKALVEYARVRGIVIIPEIDLPGHSSPLWWNYPETFGSIDKKTGKPTPMYVINMAKEDVYAACEIIVSKLAEIFYTSPYINYGGDEVYLEVLKKVPEYMNFCRKNDLNEAVKGEAGELFCYFINRMNEIVKKHGKKSIIWEGFHGTGVGDIVISKDIKVIVWNTTYNRPETLLEGGFEIINATWKPWYLVGAMNFAPMPEDAYSWDVTKWSHWKESIDDLELPSKEGILGGQICFWEQNYFRVNPLLSERVPVLSERLWNNENEIDQEEFMENFRQANERFESLFHPVKIKAEGLLSDGDQTFQEEVKIKLSGPKDGEIRYFYSKSWGIPEMKSGDVYEAPFTRDSSGVLTVQYYNGQGEKTGFVSQKYYQRIEPIYHYKVYGSSPEKGWSEMPDFSQLPVIREGVTGRMTPDRLEMINGELFARVKSEGHIETRFEGLYNPYALSLKGSINCPKADEYSIRFQTDDGLADIYINGILAAQGQSLKRENEDFTLKLEAGIHEFEIRYFYKSIQNQLNIMFKTPEMENYLPFEQLVQGL